MGAKQGGGDAGGSDSLRTSPESPRLSRLLTLCAAPRGGEDHADAPPTALGPVMPGPSWRAHICCRLWRRREARGTSRRISQIWRLGRFLPEWAAQSAKAQIPGSARSVRQRAFGRPRRIPDGALHIRDQLHLVSGKFSEGQADHYILPAVPCPMIDPRGDLDDRNSRWQNRQTAMLARTCPGPAGARGTPGRALGRCGTIYTKPSYSPLDVALAASCILGHRIQLHPLDALRGATSV